MWLTDQARELVGIGPDVPIVIDPITRADLVEACLEVEEHAHLPARLVRAAHQAADQPTGPMVERQPAIRVRFLIKEVNCAA